MDKDINDVFDDIALAENRFTEIGYKEGYSAGLALGWVEGFNFGIGKGSQLGSEIAFYSGFVQTAIVMADNSQLTERCLKSIKALSNLLAAFPTAPNEDVQLEDKLKAIRGKFRQICSLLGITSEMSSYPSRNF